MQFVIVPIKTKWKKKKKIFSHHWLLFFDCIRHFQRRIILHDCIAIRILFNFFDCRYVALDSTSKLKLIEEANQVQVLCILCNTLLYYKCKGLLALRNSFRDGFSRDYKWQQRGWYKLWTCEVKGQIGLQFKPIGPWIGKKGICKKCEIQSLKPLDPFRKQCCPRPTLCVPQLLYQITNLWKFRLNRSSESGENNGKTHPCFRAFRRVMTCVSNKSIILVNENLYCFDVFSKSKAFRGIIFQEKSFTIAFCKPCKLFVNLWTLFFFCTKSV